MKINHIISSERGKYFGMLSIHRTQEWLTDNGWLRSLNRDFEIWSKGNRPTSYLLVAPYTTEIIIAEVIPYLKPLLPILRVSDDVLEVYIKIAWGIGIKNYG